jgi:hypothetical protein
MYVEADMRPVEEPDIERFLCGAVPWAEASPDELAAGYRAMAADEEREREATEWIEGMKRGVTDD